MKNSQRLRVKKRLALSSLEAAICNVALFKAMKQKEFRDSIFISYNETGVILEAVNEKQWNRANDYINNFIKSKRIQLLTYGHDRQVYEDLINHELKDYTKKLKDSEQDCPYVNLIHYQRLRKSCEFMDREKYVEPLKAWEKKNAHTPNFAYLVVEPKERFEEVKRHILQMLRGDGTPIKTISIKPKQFLVLFFNSQHSLRLKEMYEKKEIDLVAKNNTQTISSTIYGEIDLAMPQVLPTQPNKKLFKLGFPIIKNELIRKQISELKQCYGEVAAMLMKMNERYIAKYGPNYCFIMLNKDNKPTVKAKVQQILSSQLEIQVIKDQICKYIVCQYNDLKFVQDVYNTKYYQAKLVLVNDCQMLAHYYDLKDQELQSFKTYLQQLGKYYNASLVRFYGICVKALNQYVIIMDYKPRSIQYMIDNCQFIDEIQVSTIILQLLYSINFLHTHDEPRFLGQLNSYQIYFPTCIVLPYLPDNLEDQYTFENDVKLVGELFKQLCLNPNEQIDQLIQEMIEPNSFKRIKMAQAIVNLQDIINS